MLYDFHTHTFFSDGVLSPLELAYRCSLNGYAALAITDHAGPSNLETIIAAMVRDCALASERWGLTVLPGVELTYVPPEDIDLIALRAKELGAKVVVVHGETVAERVPPGTNLAAARAAAVDIIAHPGLVDGDTLAMARDSGKFIEISARPSHGVANGHVAALCVEVGAPMILNSDAHGASDMLTEERAFAVARAAGLSEILARKMLFETPQTLLQRIGAAAVPQARARGVT